MILYEVANFNKYKNIWAKELFDKVTAIDPSPEKMYETWLLDTIRKQTIYEIKGGLSQLKNIIPSEYIKYFLGRAFLDAWNDTTVNVIVTPFGDLFFYAWSERLRQEVNLSIDERNILSTRAVFNVYRSFFSETPQEQSVTFQKYVETDEDVPALRKALKIHRLLLQGNRLTPEQKNITNFKTIQQLIQFTTPYLEEFEFDEAVLEGTSEVQPGRDFNILFKDDKTWILEILNFKASEYWACVGTSWCVRYDKRYFGHYSANGKKPAIFYINIGQHGKRYKLAFFEADDVQYRSPSNNDLDWDDFKTYIKPEHYALLKNYLWIFDVLVSGETEIDVDLETYQENMGEIERVDDIIDLGDLKGMKWDDMTPAQQTLLQRVEEVIFDWSMDWDYEALSEDDIGDYLKGEEPEGGVDKEECSTCKATGYALTPREYWDGVGWNSSKYLTVETYEKVLKQIKEKAPELVDDFKSAYKKEKYHGNIPYRMALVDRDKMVKVAEHFKQKCSKCEGKGYIEGEEHWSDEQIEEAEQNYRDEQMEYAEEETWREISRISNINKLPDSIQEAIWTYAETLKWKMDLEEMTPEQAGNMLVQNRGYKVPEHIQTQRENKKNLIKKLLKRFK